MTEIQQRPESPTVILTWHVYNYKVYKLHQSYIINVWKYCSSGRVWRLQRKQSTKQRHVITMMREGSVQTG